MSALSMIKRTYFAENKKLKPSINKSYRGEERSSEGVEMIFIEIIKTYILILIKNLIASETILFK